MKPILTIGLGLLLSVSGNAEEPLYIPPENLNDPCQPCAPLSVPIVPAMPTAPGAVANPAPPMPPTTSLDTTPLNATPTPGESPVAVPQSSGASFAFESSPSAGTGSSASIAPNLMGDLFGARSINIDFTRRLTVTFPNVPRISPNGFRAVPKTALFNLTPLPGMQGGAFATGPLPALGRLDPFVQNTLGNNARIAPMDAFVTQAILQSAFSGQPVNPQAVALLPANIRAQLPQIQGVVNGQLTNATNGLTLPNVTVSGVEGNVVPTVGKINDFVYTALLTGRTTIPLPGAGSVVGRVKLSEDNNPLPRNRLIFNYDYFDNVPFTQNGINVNRFQTGFEKTFFNGRASFEMRLPFAGTIASTTIQGFEVKDTELGNLRMALKYLWTQNPYVNFSSGLGLTLPTADDVAVISASGNLLYRFENESVTLEPFVAALFTPTDRLFGQAWSSVNFDTSGGTLIYDRNVFGGSGRADIVDRPMLAIDGQVGYWLIRNECNTLRGLAPFVELHYNRLLGENRFANTLNNRSDGQGLQINAIGNDELNLTAGITSQIGNNLFLTLGGGAPLLQQPNRTFDAQFGLRLNYLFGRSANPRVPSGYAPYGF